LVLRGEGVEEIEVVSRAAMDMSASFRLGTGFAPRVTGGTPEGNRFSVASGPAGGEDEPHGCL
jgi:hypothetical protein